ncbi:MAG: hypothetical protein ACI854_001690 [Arenicella sp.]|jgi:uncharacterized protein (TIGR00255 family)
MTQSMTAYAQAAVATELGELSCELRSVNHRFLDVAPRMPDDLRAHEGDLREEVAAKLGRGRIDIFIRLKESESSSLEPNLEAADNLQALLDEMRQSLPEMQMIRAIDVLKWPGILQAKKADPVVMKAHLLDALDQALDGLVQARAKEGGKMAELINRRLISMSAVIKDIEAFLPDMVEAYKARLDHKLADIKERLDPVRLEQELVIFLQKTDVAEEIDRLNVHIEEVAAVLAKPEPAGRRLDFLMQELNRETNTLGSKSQDPRLTKASVDLKVLIEQIREQVQNIE